MADPAQWRQAAESELRAVGRDLAVPPAADVTAAVRRQLEEQATGRRHLPALRAGMLRPRAPRRLAWRAALATVMALLTILIATPQGRAVIIGVLRFTGIELRQEPGPVPSAHSGATLPGERQMPLTRARHRVSFPILVPAALGRPGEVVVSAGGRVVSLIYHQARYGQIRIDEFAGHLDQIYFEKFVHLSGFAEVAVNGNKGLWIKGPHELIYITRDGTQATASARLTTGNTLIWGTRHVALRLEGNLTKATALAIADSAR